MSSEKKSGQTTFSFPFDKVWHVQIVALVDQIFSLTKQLAAAKTDFEHTASLRQNDSIGN